MAVEDIEVLGCGIISWKPPPGNELEELNYVVKFFDGPTYGTTDPTTGYRSLQQYFGTDNIGKQSAVAIDLPYGTTVYADVSVCVSMVYIHHISKYSLSLCIGSCNKQCRTRSILRNSYCCR